VRRGSRLFVSSAFPTTKSASKASVYQMMSVQAGRFAEPRSALKCHCGQRQHSGIVKSFRIVPSTPLRSLQILSAFNVARHGSYGSTTLQQHHQPALHSYIRLKRLLQCGAAATESAPAAAAAVPHPKLSGLTLQAIVNPQVSDLDQAALALVPSIC
jgi:hypothetical protein